MDLSELCEHVGCMDKRQGEKYCRKHWHFYYRMKQRETQIQQPPKRICKIVKCIQQEYRNQLCEQHYTEIQRVKCIMKFRECVLYGNKNEFVCICHCPS